MLNPSQLAALALIAGCAVDTDVPGGLGAEQAVGEGGASGPGGSAQGEEALNVPPHDCDAGGGGQEDCVGEPEGGAVSGGSSGEGEASGPGGSGEGEEGLKVPPYDCNAEGQEDCVGEPGPGEGEGEDEGENEGDDEGEDEEPPPDPDAPLVAPNEFGPAARLTSAAIPPNLAAARAAGCAVMGSNGGTGLHNLLLLAGGDLDRYLEPNEDGIIEMLLMAQALGWPDGVRASEVGQVDFRFLRGQEGNPGELWITADSYVDGEPLMGWDETPVTPRRWLETSPGPFELRVPLFDDFPVTIVVDHAIFSGPVRAEDGGFASEGATLTGYVVRDWILELVTGLLEACDSEAPPGICALLDGAIPPGTPPEEAVEVLLTFLGGLDVRYDGGFPRACDDMDEDDALPDCNAVSLCLLFELSPVEIAGVAPAEQ